MSYYIYMMTNYTNKVIYTGVTNNLAKRVYEHRNGLILGFTEKYHLKKFVYFEEYPSIKDAIQREKQIKNGSRKKKIALIEGMNPEWKDLYDQLL